MGRVLRLRDAMSELPAELAPLAHLDLARSDAGRYFTDLLDDANELVRVGAWCAAVERQAIRPERYARLIELSALYGAVRSRAFRYFEDAFEHELAAKIAATGGDRDAETAAMLAELDDNAEAAEAAAR